jgi:hypothetical protein
MKNVIYILLLIFLSFINGFTQVSQEWAQRYNGPASGLDLTTGMFINKNGEIIVYGHSTGSDTQLDITILKYSSAGSLLWDYRYNGPNNGSDQLQSAVSDNNGNIYAVGNVTQSLGASMTVLKLSDAGDLEWIKKVGLTGYNESFGKDVIVSSSGSIYSCGFARNVQNNYDLIIAKISNPGIVQWIKTYDIGGNNESPVNILCDINENIFIVGTSADLSGNEKLFYVKYDSSGNEAGAWIYSPNSRAVSGVMDSSGKIVIAGVTYSQSSNFDYLTIRINPIDTSYWNRIYNGPGNNLDYSYKTITDPECNVYVTGSSRNSSSIGSEDVFTIKYDSSGNQIWTNRFDSHPGGSDIGYSLTLDRNSNVYIAAAIDRDTNHLIFGTMKIKSMGELEWLRTYEYFHTPEDFPYSIAIDTADNVYTSGISFGGSTDYDMTTIKYSQSIGLNTTSNTLPEKFLLHQNYPNPFNPQTLIKFELPVSGYLKLAVYNSAGKEISILYSGHLDPGVYEYEFHGTPYSSGIYFINAEFNDFNLTRKMLLLK